jgi:phosphoglycerate dehydrogenase-like enzyme
VPLAVATAETENLIGKDAFAKMKQGAYLINVSRGNLVDEAALEAALDSGGSPAARWTWAARPTRCRRRASPRART